MLSQSTTSPAVETAVFSPDAWASVKPLWQDLAGQSPYSTFFVTAEWVESWLEVFGPRVKCDFLVFRSAGRVVGICLLVFSQFAYRFIRVNRVHVNTAGEPDGSPYIEFNNLLCLEGFEKQVAESIRAYLERKDWDEVSIDGFCPGPPLEALRAAFPKLDHQPDPRNNFYIALNPLRTVNASYESVLGSKTRYRLRQNYKHYGEIITEAASDAGQALAFLEEMAALHQEHWIRLGEEGSFASPSFAAFHRALIQKTFDLGNIQMLRFSASGSVIGLMYNFVCKGKVYFYQSGLAYNENKRIRPGFVSIGKAVEFALKQPELTEFHLMPGGDHYKESMGTDCYPVEWLVLRKPNIKFHTVALLRKVRQTFHNKAQEPAAPVSDESGS